MSTHRLFQLFGCAAISLYISQAPKELTRKGLNLDEPVTHDFSLEELLHLAEPASFFRDHWERSPYVVSRGDPGYYADLFCLADVDTVVSLTSPAPSEYHLSLVKSDGGRLSEQPVPGTADRTPDVYSLYRAYHEGYTIIANRLDARWQPVSRLCRQLEATLHHRVGANLYFTPPRAQGFLPHFDTHDVFILQLGGSKVWRLYDVFIALPLADANHALPNNALGPHRQEVVLEPGDLLYIPRGHVHEALTGDAHSLHLTVGIYAVRWVEVVNEALMLTAAEDVRFREGVPVGFLSSPDTIASMETRLKELLRAVGAGAQASGAIKRLADRFFHGGHPVPDGHFAALDRLRDMDGDTLVERRAGLACVVDSANGHARIRFPGNHVSGPAVIEPALRFVERTRRFAVRELPDCLTDNAKRILVDRLVREGLLTIVQP